MCSKYFLLAMTGKGLVEITFELSLEGEVGVCGGFVLKEFITKYWTLGSQYDSSQNVMRA